MKSIIFYKWHFLYLYCKSLMNFSFFFFSMFFFKRHFKNKIYCVTKFEKKCDLSSSTFFLFWNLIDFWLFTQTWISNNNNENIRKWRNEINVQFGHDKLILSKQEYEEADNFFLIQELFETTILWKNINNIISNYIHTSNALYYIGIFLSSESYRIYIYLIQIIHSLKKNNLVLRIAI